MVTVLFEPDKLRTAALPRFDRTLYRFRVEEGSAPEVIGIVRVRSSPYSLHIPLGLPHDRLVPFLFRLPQLFHRWKGSSLLRTSRLGRDRERDPVGSRGTLSLSLQRMFSPISKRHVYRSVPACPICPKFVAQQPSRCSSGIPMTTLLGSRPPWSTSPSPRTSPSEQR